MSLGVHSPVSNRKERKFYHCSLYLFYILFPFRHLTRDFYQHSSIFFLFSKYNLWNCIFHRYLLPIRRKIHGQRGQSVFSKAPQCNMEIRIFERDVKRAGGSERLRANVYSTCCAPLAATTGNLFHASLIMEYCLN